MPIFTMLLLVALVFPGVSGAKTTLEQQRERFVQAEKALKTGKLSLFRQLEPGLRTYPLHPYLEYAALQRRLPTARNAEIRAFLERHADTPQANRMRSAWLKQLAKKRRWSD